MADQRWRTNAKRNARYDNDLRTVPQRGSAPARPVLSLGQREGAPTLGKGLGCNMMRLRETERTRRRLTLMVEGRLTNGDAQLLAARCQTAFDTGRTVRLDFSNVTLVDAQSAASIRSLQSLGVEITRCPPLILEFVASATDRGRTRS